MNDYLEVIKRLKAIREEKARLVKKELELCIPKLTNLEYIPIMYKWLSELVDEREEFEKITKVNFEKEFLVIILYFYSPTTLGGGNMTKGLRAELVHLFGVHAPTAVSNYCANALVWYDSYKFFQQEVALLLDELLAHLKAEGILVL